MKDQIRKILKQHEKAVDEIKDFQKLAKNFSLEELQNSLEEVSKKISLSLDYIASDQKTKLDLLKQMDLIKDKPADYDTTMQKVFNAIRIPSTVMLVAFTAAEFASGDYFDGVIDGLMVVLDMVNNILTIIHDEKEKKKLEKKKKSLEEYFKPGGKFESIVKDCEKLVI